MLFVLYFAPEGIVGMILDSEIRKDLVFLEL